jgi:hypothetical protein
MSRQYSRGGLGSRKHGKGGTPGHNADMIQTNRELNEEQARIARLRKAQRGKLYGTVRALMDKRRER